MDKNKNHDNDNFKKIHRVEGKFRPDKARLNEIAQQCADALSRGNDLDDFEEMYDDAPLERGKKHFQL